jgi:hypothetical protein
MTDKKVVKENQKDSPEEVAFKDLSQEDQINQLDARVAWSHQNIQRVISYIDTLERWRHMPFYPTDKDGNAIDKDGNKIDPNTGEHLKANPKDK